MMRQGAIPFAPQGGVENKHGKANILIQASVSLDVGRSRQELDNSGIAAWIGLWEEYSGWCNQGLELFRSRHTPQDVISGIMKLSKFIIGDRQRPF
jgi:hypothetical protein